MNFKVLKTIEEVGFHEGEILNLEHLTVAALDEYVKDGVLSPVEESQVATPGASAVVGNATGAVAAAVVAASSDESHEPRKRFRGQIVVSEGMREVNGAEFHNIRIADGSSYDLNEVEYEAEVKISYPPVK